MRDSGLWSRPGRLMSARPLLRCLRAPLVYPKLMFIRQMGRLPIFPFFFKT
jgi:hypothetical protein